MLPFAAPITFGNQSPTEPVVPLPTAPQAQSTLGQIVSGAYNGAVKPAVEFAESPVGFATLGLGAAPAAVSRGVAALFAPYAFKNAADATDRFNTAYNDPTATLQDKVAPLADAVSQGLMGVGAARHALPAPDLSKLFVTAYHGTPHNFDRFDMSKIGTGEGAQSYGHGLYFAEHPNTAKSYKTAGVEIPEEAVHTVNGEEFNNENPYHLAAYQLHDKGSVEAAQSELASILADVQNKRETSGLQKGFYEPQISAFQKAIELAGSPEIQNYKFTSAYPQGNLYKVDLAPNLEDFLHWDKPLSEQGQQVQAALADLVSVRKDPDALRSEQWGVDFNRPEADPIPLNGFPTRKAANEYLQTLAGENIYGPMSLQMGPRHASEYLHSLGIPGIAYLDQGSRGAGNGTHNFVMFDDKGIKILERNGQPVSSLFQQ